MRCGGKRFFFESGGKERAGGCRRCKAEPAAPMHRSQMYLRCISDVSPIAPIASDQQTRINVITYNIRPTHARARSHTRAHTHVRTNTHIHAHVHARAHTHTRTHSVRQMGNGLAAVLAGVLAQLSADRLGDIGPFQARSLSPPLSLDSLSVPLSFSLSYFLSFSFSLPLSLLHSIWDLLSGFV